MLVAAAVALLPGCGGGSGSGSGSASASSLVRDGFTVYGPWARPTPATATDGVVYFSLRSDTADALTGATVDPAVAARASLHTTTGTGAAGGHQHGGGGGDGTVAMEAVASFPLEPAKVLVFAPGGNHLMLEGLARPLVAGQRVAVTLTFSSGRTLGVDAVVADNPPV